MSKIDPEVELIARTLYAFNTYPGRKPIEVPWPPTNKPTLKHYLNLGAAVIAAQRATRLGRPADVQED